MTSNPATITEPQGASLPIPFAIGETVWRACIDAEEKRVECPECAGTCALTLVKGNGESISIDCNYCSLGYEAPRGFVVQRIRSPGPKEFTCRSVTMWSSDEFNYSDGTHSCSTSHLFRDRAKCEAKCVAMVADENEHEIRCSIAVSESKRRTLAFSSHYWSREVKDLERKLERARARLSVCPKPRKKLCAGCASESRVAESHSCNDVSKWEVAL